jgi:hypothetical protein
VLEWQWLLAGSSLSDHHTSADGVGASLTDPVMHPGMPPLSYRY